MADKSKLESMMRKITALLQRADHPNTPEAEASSARAMAERMMVKYRIEESDLIASGALDDEAHKPGMQVIVMCPMNSPFRDAYYNLMIFAVGHAGCRMVYQWDYNEQVLKAEVVGYQADIRYAEALYTQARIVFGERMEPKPNPALSDDDNVYNLRQAGMERIRIAALMGWGEPGTGKGGAGRVTSAYKRACKARGEEPVLTGRGMSVATFREEYWRSFTSEFHWRLHQMRLGSEVDTAGKELVLAGRQEQVDEEFYRMYPHMRPIKRDDRQIGEGKASKRVRITKAMLRDMERRSTAAGQAGRSAGKKAAQEVDITGGRKARPRLEN